jgi:hypothetical protein
MAFQEKRAHYRLHMRVPIFVRGKDLEGKDFFEFTHTTDVSAAGAKFLCQHALDMTRNLVISIPAPVDIKQTFIQDYGSEFPAKITRIEAEPPGSAQKISVKFEKLLYE